jgi:hypothetical protein
VALLNVLQTVTQIDDVRNKQAVTQTLEHGGIAASHSDIDVNARERRPYVWH